MAKPIQYCKVKKLKINTDEVSLSCPLLTSCCVAQFLTGHRLVQVPWPRGCPLFYMTGQEDIYSTNKRWHFIVPPTQTDVEAEAPILWSPDANRWLIRKDPDAGKEWRQEEEMTEDEMVVWYHWLNRHDFEQALGDGKGQGSLACCSPWGCRVRYDWVTEQHRRL